MSRVTAIIAAAGHGTRLGRRKQLMTLLDKPVLAWSLETIAASAHVTDVVVACETDEMDACAAAAAASCGTKLHSVVAGGERRQDSVFAGLRAAPPDTAYVLVHDGARPFITGDMIDRVLAAARTFGAAVVAIPVKDTIKQATEGDIVLRTIPRDQLWSAQTPQAFAFDVLYKAYSTADSEGYVGTDDAMLVEWCGNASVSIVEGSYENVKITTAEDLFLAERIARERSATKE